MSPNSLDAQRARSRAAGLAELAAHAILMQEYTWAEDLLGQSQRLLAEIKEKEGSDAA